MTAGGLGSPGTDTDCEETRRPQEDEQEPERPTTGGRRATPPHSEKVPNAGGFVFGLTVIVVANSAPRNGRDADPRHPHRDEPGMVRVVGVMRPSRVRLRIAVVRKRTREQVEASREGEPEGGRRVGAVGRPEGEGRQLDDLTDPGGQHDERGQRRSQRSAGSRCPAGIPRTPHHISERRDHGARDDAPRTARAPPRRSSAAPRRR